MRNALLLILLGLSRFSIAIGQELSGKTKEISIHDSSRVRLTTGRLINVSTTDYLATGEGLGIRSYGSGGLSLLGLRGANPSQNLITWEGIPLNSSLNGQLDLSLLDLSIFNRAILERGVSTNGNSGQIGGALDLSTQGKQPVSSGRFFFNAGHDSFRNSRFLLKGDQLLRLDGLSLVISFQKLENRFTYGQALNSPRDSVQKRGVGYAINTLATYQFPIRKGWKTKASFWFNQSDRTVPYATIVSPTFDWQSDRGIRGLLLASDSTRQQSHSMLIGREEMTYFNSLEGEASKFVSNHLKSRHVGRVSAHLDKLHWSILTRLEQVYATSYNESAPSYWVVISPGLTYTSKEALVNYEAQIFWDYFQGKATAPRGSLVVDSKFFNSMRMSLRLSTNQRFPTTNELYWPVVGSQNLKPEYAYSFQGSLEYASKWINIKLLPYLNYTTNYVLWVPNNTGLWRPENVGLVRAKGLDVLTELTCDFGEVQSKLLTKWNFVNAVPLTQQSNSYLIENQQLIFVPALTSSSQLRFRYSRCQLELGHQFIAERNSGSGQNRELAPFNLYNTSLAYSPTRALQLGLQVFNVFDKDYRWIPYFPTPGRQFQISLTISV